MNIMNVTFLYIDCIFLNLLRLKSHNEELKGGFWDWVPYGDLPPHQSNIVKNLNGTL